MFKVDLNSDLGESFGAYRIGCDKEVLEQVTSANVACGWHAGDPVVLSKTLAMAREQGVCVGAHPGYPDLMGFGRRDMKLTPDEEYAYTLYQLGAFAAFAKKNGLEIQHLKPHGAMYNNAGKDINLALAICRAVKDFDPNIILLGLSGSKLIEAAEELGLKSASEIFADRAYEENGSLVNRKKPGAMIEGVVDVSEMMGSSVHLHIDVDGKDCIIIVPTLDLDTGNLGSGAKVRFTFAPNAVHMFDPETEENLENLEFMQNQ